MAHSINSKIDDINMNMKGAPADDINMNKQGAPAKPDAGDGSNLPPHTPHSPLQVSHVDPLELAGNFEICLATLSQADLCLAETRERYTLPSRLKRSSSKKAKLAKYESVDPGQYEAGAHCVTFRTSLDHLHAWIRALWVVYYNTMGEMANAQVQWAEEEGIITIQVSKTDTKTEMSSDGILFKITVYMTTGLLMVQGKEFLAWVHRDLPCITDLVNAIEKMDNNGDKTMVAATHHDSSADSSEYESDSTDTLGHQSHNSSCDSDISMNGTIVEHFTNGNRNAPNGNTTLTDASDLNLNTPKQISKLVEGTDETSDRQPHTPKHTSTPKAEIHVTPASQPGIQPMMEALKNMEGNIARFMTNLADTCTFTPT
jgi:hypothetical protein